VLIPFRFLGTGVTANQETLIQGVGEKVQKIRYCPTN
jgi:hypothetical protein